MQSLRAGTPFNTMASSPLSKAPPVLEKTVRGAVAGGTYGATEQLADTLYDYKGDGDQSNIERLKSVGKDAALFAVADPLIEEFALPLVKKGASKLVNAKFLPKAKEPVMGKQVEKAVPIRRDVAKTPGEPLPIERKPLIDNAPASVVRRGVKEQTLPMEERVMENVGKRNVNAYQFDNPELQPHIQGVAKELSGDLGSTVKGERFPVKNVDGTMGDYTGTSRFSSETIERIKDTTKASYKDIQQALDDIILDKGRENNALSKRIELIIDDNLRQGYKTFDGYAVPPNAEYIKMAEMIESGKSARAKNNSKGLNRLNLSLNQ